MGVLTTGYLMVNSWTDWRRKEVDIVWTVAVFVLTAFIYVGTDQKLCWSGLLPGICLWLASLWRSDQIGSGDGIVLMGIGWIQGIITPINTFCKNRLQDASDSSIPGRLKNAATA